MNSEEINWVKLLRYVRGKGDPEEREEIEAWIGSDADREALVSFIAKVWDTPAEQKQDWDVDSAWLRYNIQHGKDFEEATEDAGIEEMDPIGWSENMNIHSTKSKKTGGLSWGLVIAAAASVLLVVLFTSQMEKEDTVSSTTPTKEVVSNYGQRVHLRLSDGTKVILNAGSKIIAPETFSDSVRNVRLEGQAFFDVATDSARPFLVNTNRSVTEVLGTKFDIQAYPENGPVTVTVAEGKVALRSKQDTANIKGKAIAKNHQGHLSPEGIATVIPIEDVTAQLGWTEGRLVFINDPLDRVKTTLERWYDIQIEIKSDNSGQLENRRFTGSFTDSQSMEEILEAIALSLNLKYKEATSDGSYVMFE